MSIELLEIAVADFSCALSEVTEAEWSAQTVCDDWDVRGLVNHMVGGALMTEAVLQGGSREEAVALMSTLQLSSNPKEDLLNSASAHVAAFRALDSLDTVVHHPAADMPAAQLLNFRIGDYVLHTWDLVTSLGKSVELNADCVQFVWTALQPMAPFIGQLGMFGEGPSGTVSEDAPLQDRLVDFTGRRLN